MRAQILKIHEMQYWIQLGNQTSDHKSDGTYPRLINHSGQLLFSKKFYISKN